MWKEASWEEFLVLFLNFTKYDFSPLVFPKKTYFSRTKSPIFHPLGALASRPACRSRIGATRRKHLSISGDGSWDPFSLILVAFWCLLERLQTQRKQHLEKCKPLHLSFSLVWASKTTLFALKNLWIPRVGNGDTWAHPEKRAPQLWPQRCNWKPPDGRAVARVPNIEKHLNFDLSDLYLYSSFTNLLPSHYQQIKLNQIPHPHLPRQVTAPTKAMKPGCASLMSVATAMP